MKLFYHFPILLRYPYRDAAQYTLVQKKIFPSQADQRVAGFWRVQRDHPLVCETIDIKPAIATRPAM